MLQYKWHFDYVRLAVENGFEFVKQKSEQKDKTRIYSIDVDRVIKSKDLGTVEKLIPYIVEFGLDEEQARILDETFVKTFRISQLSVQYLLFCKEYLDNSVILLRSEKNKVQEENNELKLFVNELKQHIAELMQELNEKSAITTFKCDECTKVFSTNEFLGSHKKRRHSANNAPEGGESLHIEMKELKGRLNSAEKQILRDQNTLPKDAIPVKDSDFKLVDELQWKFERLRLHVESELKVLQTQHNYEEKYAKWVEKLIQQHKPPQKDETIDVSSKKEAHTQTQETTHQQTDVIEIETKVSSSLQNIENQIEQVWKKIHTIESAKEDSSDNDRIAPIAKPRSKFTIIESKSQGIVAEPIIDSDPIIDTASIPSPKQREIIDLSPSNDAESMPASAVIKPKKRKKVVSKPIIVTESIPTPRKTRSASSNAPDEGKSETSSAKTNLEGLFSSYTSEVASSDLETKKYPESSASSVLYEKQKPNEKLLSRVRIASKKLISAKLQELGVNPDWAGLPDTSFRRALQIVHHQGALLKRKHPNFDKIRLGIEKNLMKGAILVNYKGKKSSKSVKSRVTRGKGGSPAEIRNRRMYETDSDSEPKERIAYSDVIAELRTVAKKAHDSEGSSIRQDEGEQTKGVLKNYPSVASLSKKRVIFDLKSEKENRPQQSKSGSTTSITSSVFDATPKHNAGEPQPSTSRGNDVEDLSDLEFSD